MAVGGEEAVSRFSRFLAAFILVLGDCGAVAVSFVLGYLARNFVFSAVLHALPPVLAFEALGYKLYVLAVYPFVFAYEGLYTKRLLGWEETRRYLRGILIATAVVVILLFLWRYWIVSRLAIAFAILFCAVLAPLVRALLKRLLAAIRLGAKPLVVLGGGNAAELFGRELARHRALGYEVVQRVERAPADEPVISLLEQVRRDDVTLVVVSDSFSPAELRSLFRLAERRFAEVLVVPNETLLESSAADVEQVGSVLVMKYRYNLLRPLNRYTKRVFEIVLAVVLFALLVPLLGLLAVLVRLSSPGPVFFRQRRIGRFGREFACVKFRTMYVDAEARLAELLKSDQAVRAEYEQYARITDDPRVTGIGRFLRRTSFDEWPQLLNVLRGEMALVGPRPYLPSEAPKVGEYLATITRVRPGMSGLWQVSGRAALSFRERTLLDDYYIRNWSLWMDFSILLRTFRAVFGARGAY